MSMLRRSLIAFGFALPAPLAAHAQAAKIAQTAHKTIRQDLIGQWRSRDMPTKDTSDVIWTFRADSTWRYETRLNGTLYGQAYGGRWTASSDTLYLTDTATVRAHSSGTPPARPYWLHNNNELLALDSDCTGGCCGFHRIPTSP